MKPSLQSLLLLGCAAGTTTAAAADSLSSSSSSSYPTTSEPSSTFDVREATIESLHNALFTGLTTCRGVVSSYLARVEALNPTINAVSALNPDCLAEADDLDAQLSGSGGTRNATGKLFCVPVLLKDNYDAVPMNTTGACSALAGNKPLRDARTVAALRREGAVILGKVNLHELALEGLSVSSLGGQTLNPYDLTRTPGGSSGGTGAAIAASLAVLGTGTDTVNSLRSPASANSLVSVRPTRGLVTRAGVVPISYTQDTVGPIARTVADLAVALEVMESATTMGGSYYDEADNVTALVPDAVRAGRDYGAAVARAQSGGAAWLSGLRIGLLDGFWNHTASAETTPVNEAMADMVSWLEGQGVELFNITDPVYDATAIADALDVQRYEYRELLTGYLSGPGLAQEGDTPRSFMELYYGGGGGGNAAAENERDFLVIPSEYEYVNTASVSSTGNATYAAKQRGIWNLTLALQATFASHGGALGLDAIIYPEQKNLVVPVGSPSQSGRNGILAALTGSPVVTVPAGFSDPDGSAPVGVPIGMEILGRPWSEDKLLGIAAAVTRLRPTRRVPRTAEEVVEVKEGGYGGEVPVVRPNTGDIPEEYPLGVLS